MQGMTVTAPGGGVKGQPDTLENYVPCTIFPLLGILQIFRRDEILEAEEPILVEPEKGRLMDS